MLESNSPEIRIRGVRCWVASVLFTSCLIGSSEALAVPMWGGYELDAGSELRICGETGGCEEPVSIAGARFFVDPSSYWLLQRELWDDTWDLYEGDWEGAEVYRIHTVFNSPDWGPYAFSEYSYVTFLSDTTFRWTGTFSGMLSCNSFGLDPYSEDCWSRDYRDFELINASARWVPETSHAMLFGSGLLALLAIQGAMRKRPASSDSRLISSRQSHSFFISGSSCHSSGSVENRSPPLSSL
jgi:hypothetical protein